MLKCTCHNCSYTSNSCATDSKDNELDEAEDTQM